MQQCTFINTKIKILSRYFVCTYVDKKKFSLLRWLEGTEAGKSFRLCRQSIRGYSLNKGTVQRNKSTLKETVSENHSYMLVLRDYSPIKGTVQRKSTLKETANVTPSLYVICKATH